MRVEVFCLHVVGPEPSEHRKVRGVCNIPSRLNLCKKKGGRSPLFHSLVRSAYAPGEPKIPSGSEKPKL
jgi:hypothetical protein